MTKEISKEVIAKVFGLYYECQCVYTNIMGNFYSDVNYDVLRRLYTQPSFSPKLILSDLSDISDEDAVEVAKMIERNSGTLDIEGWSFEVSRHDGMTSVAMKRADGRHVATYTITLDNLCKHSSTDFIIEVIDFLRNPNKPSGNAYMLPAFGITDLFEAGIAVRTNKEVNNG